MTRGTFYIVEKLRKRIRVTNSCEFNGDMYEEEGGGHGGEAMRLLKKTTNQKEFKENVKEFDKKNFNYQAEGDEYFKFYETYPMEWKESWLEKQGNLVMVSFKDYFKNFFSDWTFWLNRTEDCEVQFFTREISRSMKETSGKVIKLKPGQCVAISFGHYEDHYYGAPILIKEE